MSEQSKPTDSIHPRGIVPPYVLEQMERRQRLVDLASGLAALAVSKAERTSHTPEDDAVDEMISEGGPANDNEQGDNDE